MVKDYPRDGSKVNVFELSQYLPVIQPDTKFCWFRLDTKAIIKMLNIFIFYIIILDNEKFIIIKVSKT